MSEESGASTDPSYNWREHVFQDNTPSPPRGEEINESRNENFEVWDSTLRALGFDCVALIAILWQLITTFSFLASCGSDQAGPLLRRIARTCQIVRIRVESHHVGHDDPVTEELSTEAFNASYRVDAIYLRRGEKSIVTNRREGEEAVVKEDKHEVTALDGVTYKSSSDSVYFHHVPRTTDIRLCRPCRVQRIASELTAKAEPPPTSATSSRRKPPSTSVVQHRPSPGFPETTSPEPQHQQPSAIADEVFVTSYDLDF